MKQKTSQIFTLLFFLSALLAVSQNARPVANSDAVVISNNVRFTILTPQLIRMEWSESNTFEELASLVFINRNLPIPKFTKKTKGEWLIIETEKLKLFYKTGTGMFNKDNVYITFDLNGRQVKWFPDLKDSLNLKGTARTLDETDGEKNVKLEDGLLSRSGWYLHDDTKTNLFDTNNWVIERKVEKIQDWYQPKQ